MPYTMQDFRKEVALEVLDELPPEELAKRLTPEQRLTGLRTQERLAGMSPEEVLNALPPEQIEAFVQRLRKKPNGTRGKKRKPKA